MTSGNVWVDTLFVILLLTIVSLLVMMIYRYHCIHVAYKQRDQVRYNIVSAYMLDEITSGAYTNLIDLLYKVDIKKHTNQLIWFDAPCVVYDERLWSYLPREMFEGYDEDADDPEDIGLMYFDEHQFDQPRDVVQTERNHPIKEKTDDHR